MKKRILSVFLVLAAVLTLLPCSALAVPRNYGKFPIYIGYSDVDYMAEEILKEIPTQGKSDTEQIREVYDWMVKTGGGTSSGAPKFNQSTVKSRVNRTFYKQTDKALQQGDILIRSEYENTLVYDAYYGQYVVSSDSNQYIAAFARELLYEREGGNEHYAALTAVLLSHLGFDCRVISGISGDENDNWFIHKWNCVLVDGQYYWLDVAKGISAYQRTGAYDQTYFMVGDNEIWCQSHNWGEYPDRLAADAASIAEEYGYRAALISGEPWSRCATWAEDSMKQADQMDLIPTRLQNRDLTAAISRAEFAAVAVAMYESLSGKSVPEYTDPNPFTDTDDTDVLKAYGLGVVNGIGGGLYDPNGTLTREQAMTLLGRVYELVITGAVGDGSGLPRDDVQKFDDDAAISNYARNYIYFFVSSGVVNGVGGNLLAPRNFMDRQSAIKMTVEVAEHL